MASVLHPSSFLDNGQAIALVSARSVRPLFLFFLVVHPITGNSGLRYFPCSGYLGLTPIRVDGGNVRLFTCYNILNPFSPPVVRTKLDDDQKLLQARSITISVRCYETRTRVGSNYTNILFDHTQVLWAKPDEVEFEPIGNLEFPFRITIPAKVAGFSNTIFVDYKCMWRIEAGECFSCFMSSGFDVQPSSAEPLAHLCRWLSASPSFRSQSRAVRCPLFNTHPVGFRPVGTPTNQQSSSTKTEIFDTSPQIGNWAHGPGFNTFTSSTP